MARSRAAAGEVTLQSHALVPDSVLRADPVELLEWRAGTRVAELVPIRYGRMLSSAFAFCRGAALVLASDLAGTSHSGLRAQLCEMPT